MNTVQDNWSFWTIPVAVGFLACVSYTGYSLSVAKVQKPVSRLVIADKEVTRAQKVESSRSLEITVTRLFVHPIKSCKGTSVTRAYCDEEGLKYDRKFAIIDAVTHKVITARQKHHMVLIHPTIEEDETDADGGRLVVEFPLNPDCETFAVPLNPRPEVTQGWELINDIELWGQTNLDGLICQLAQSTSASTQLSPTSQCSPHETLSRYLGHPVLLVMKGPRARDCPKTAAFPELDAKTAYADGFPLLVVSEESLGDVQRRVGDSVGVKPGVEEKWRKGKVEIERFRPNIVVRGAGIPWAEDGWRTISICATDSRLEKDQEGIPIFLVSPCARCLLPNIDTKTGIRDAAVPYKVLMGYRTRIDPERMNKACFGCNGVPLGRGFVSVGDCVRVVESFERAENY